jgi:hypothetical protein
MKVIFEKTSQINVLPNITFSKIGKFLFVSFGFLKYQMLLKFGSYD